MVGEEEDRMHRVTRIAWAICGIALLCGPGLSAPSVTGVQGTISHKSSVVVQGAGFGSKATAAPYIWDDCSGTDPLAKWDFAYPNSNNAPFRMTYRQPSEVTMANGVTGLVPLPHNRISKYFSGAHYNSGTLDAHSAYNVCAGKNNQEGKIYSYICYYMRVSPVWHASSNDHNFKEYDYAAGNGYMGNGANLYHNYTYITDPTMQLGGNYGEGMGAVISRVNTAFMTLYPYSVWTHKATASPTQKWVKVERVLKHNSADGFHFVYHDNAIQWEVYVDDDNVSSPTARAETAIGGYSNEDGNTEIFKNNWRFYADIYYDHSLARAMLTDNQDYTKATIVEPQLPSAWAASAITMDINLGKLPNSGTAYLFVFDSNNVRNTAGFPVTLGGSSTAPPPDQTPPASPQNLTVK